LEEIPLIHGAAIDSARQQDEEAEEEAACDED